ncbi:MAG: hypothetical protein N5P05_001185 [Chroococcopsis gigantea SAG 12.99]|jgi:hypothetical protein|nr:hypothetical protein [Chroococcopsis gigantea SAG 12.99]
MRIFLSYLFSFVLLIWFLLSIFRYIPKVEKWIIRWDRLALIPQWNFFAPMPNESDYYLYYRVMNNSTISPWREVVFSLDRKWYGMIWNPGRRNRKAFIDLCQALSQLAKSSREEVLTSIPYLLILNMVVRICKNMPGNIVQFSVCTVVPSESLQNLSIILLSELHSI